MTVHIHALPHLPVFRLGIDIGSISAKAVLLDPAGKLAFFDYRRHKADTRASLSALLARAIHAAGDVAVFPMTTGSAGMGVSEHFQLPFVQEVIASTQVIRRDYPQVSTLFDIGGEDAKMIFIEEGGAPDLRMNGSCAGGTGAYIDEMAALLNVSLEELNSLAERCQRVHPIASRCGVFGKTDVQNLLARAVPRQDVAASILYAVVYQVLATLARGLELKPKYLFCGGPLTFLPALRRAFMDVLGLGDGDVVAAPHLELLPAWGAALSAREENDPLSLSGLANLLENGRSGQSAGRGRLKPLFGSQEAWQRWQAERSGGRIERVPVEQAARGPCFLGIDSGSTTSKCVLIDEHGRVAFSHYTSNRGAPLQAVKAGLQELYKAFQAAGQVPTIARSAATGYGEDLVRTAFGLDQGIVETLAHYQAARAFDPQVSFILDIGGQDMKAIFVRDGVIRNIEINEACSSGCGTFIESLAGSMGCQVGEFSRMACLAESPCDLGSRCTVFMNSRIKQALREDASLEDISAGLAYSVVKNSLYKVLKLSDPSELGKSVIVQGGTFRNQAVQRAFEELTGRKVTCPEMAELMGAYGAALTALQAWRRAGREPGRGIDFEALDQAGNFQQRMINCRGCENRCTVTRLAFLNGGVFFTGNRCECIYSNRGRSFERGESLTARKLELLFERPTEPTGEPLLTIGIPRVLNMYENFPFWCTLLVECGLQVQLSDPSSQELFKKGASTVMSENICFPAKLAHGHLADLIDKGVDRIFYPMVSSERTTFVDDFNSFNCPVVTGYPDVMRNAIDPQGKHAIPFDMPTVSLRDRKLLRKACFQYLQSLGIAANRIGPAFQKAIQAQEAYKEAVRKGGAAILERARDEGRLVILLLGRPYHLDPLINHGIPQILVDLGVDVITEDSVPLEKAPALNNKNAPTQWELVNRQYYAAKWAGDQRDVEVVQINSFACGPDTYSMEEVKSILDSAGKTYTAIRIDEVESMGSSRLRLRSLIETLRLKDLEQPAHRPHKKLKLYEQTDRHKEILTPYFSPFVSPAIAAPFLQMGYKVHTLPPPDRESVEVGLRYTPNEICYPGIIVVGDLIKALQSGQYDPEQVVAASWQTGGQCRASSILSMVRRALLAAGFQNTPILAISTSRKLVDQPGFKLNWLEYIPKAFLAVIYADAISSLFHASVIREEIAGQSRALADELLAPLREGILPLEREAILARVRDAAARFNEIKTTSRQFFRVGIVGEIYVKYNPFCNINVSQWLMDHGLEVVLPPFLQFFLGWFVSNHVRVEQNLARWKPFLPLADLVERQLQSVIDQVEASLQRYKHHLPRHTIRDIAKEAQRVVSLAHAYGEGWLIAGEAGLLADNGVPNILCLQPFGCIANQVVARGAAKKMKEVHRNLNMLFLDLDAGVSEANYFNRLHFFARQALGL
jgi:predicted CoA-substrate-specific enzyme activase